MTSARHLRLPIRTRIDLLLLGPRARLLRRRENPVRLRKGSVYVSAEDLAIDRATFDYVFMEHAYDCEYQNALVLDIGAHKGYYGAYALLRGAHSVRSLEPEARNFSLLERCASAFRSRGFEWSTSKTAVGSEEGELDLHVGEESWGHSLDPPDDFRQIGLQRVTVVSMRSLMEDARAAARGASRLIVKVNAEGSECDIVFSTPMEAWQAAEEVFIERHAWAPCTSDEIVGRLEGAGLSAHESMADWVLYFSRG
jgi:FkbM family methyltransferase